MFNKQWYPKAAKQLFFYPVNAITSFYNTQQQYSSINVSLSHSFIQRNYVIKVQQPAKDPVILVTSLPHMGMTFPLVAH